MQQKKQQNTGVDGMELIKTFSDFISKGGTLKMLQNVSDDAMNALYSNAYSMYQTGKYSNGIKMFQALCMLDHYQEKYFLGLGACRQMIKQYEEAIEAFTMFTFLTMEDPRGLFHTAECCIAMGENEHAEKNLNSAIEWCGDREEFSALKAKAKAMLKHIQGQGKE